MASAEVRQIRRRIKSVESTMKITRAMELIATARIGKAQVRVAQAKPYTEKMNDVIRNIATATGSLSHPLLERRDVKDIGVLVVTSDRGLAGGYNTSVIRFAEAAIQRHQAEGKTVRVYTIGDKALSYFRFRRYMIAHSWLNVTDTPTYRDARSIANIVLDEYASERVDAVEAYTTEYISALTQNAIFWPVLPIEPPEDDADAPSLPVGYTFEPSPEEILGRLLPRYLEGTVFGMLLEASASEHAARRRAMKAATENAEELTRLLTREANQARQAEITTEISEIVGGAEALAHG
ncbi:MAG: F0F1 ATP synthase subunit gamma [Actinomycetota bacterium]|nr:F0F1 ATP synthase subunit gamma [Actinomycetota bacterium]MDK1027183.1 F0F1 ATP synthase subunit gamma [Actinomycetota bacterium]MDK1097654.1 F0F1 ATP synthase subunit gamma [Actinomycetota bacterium]MDK1103998.1 F0F1 ATP synthase subunit gamma [Actinomycetota bacterium]MDK1292798.1 F0F1 ATP synthase subunit gamma [Actinomycetota bacterium]